MGFDEIYKHRKRHSEHYPDAHQYHGNYRENYPDRMPGYEHYIMYILGKVWSNRKLRVLFVIFALLTVVLITAVVIMLIPLIIKVLNAISQGGLKGIADSITGFIDKIWNGSAK